MLKIYHTAYDIMSVQSLDRLGYLGNMRDNSLLPKFNCKTTTKKTTHPHTQNIQKRIETKKEVLFLFWFIEVIPEMAITNFITAMRPAIHYCQSFKSILSTTV